MAPSRQDGDADPNKPVKHSRRGPTVKKKIFRDRNEGKPRRVVRT